jgi:hypothetical protein
MAKIIRTPTQAKGGITPEEKSRMDDHALMWNARAMRTSPIEPDKIIPAIEGIYEAAGLKKPRVVIASSPLVMAFAYGAAAAILYSAATYAATYAATDAATRAATYAATDAATRAATYAATYDATRTATDAATRAATRAATYAATYAATGAATGAATRAATYAATGAATRAATYAATDAATRAATDAATRAATDAATRAATYAATDAATRAATYAATYAATDAATYDAEQGASAACFELAGAFGIACAQRWYSAYQGGNMWADYDCYLTACRDILGLQLPEHEKYTHWEQAAIHGGFRVMHEEFCIVSDFPEIIKIDAENRPHCEIGPSHCWRDGWCLYHWHGVKIPGEWIDDRKSLTPQIALTWKNIEQRRAACEILGWANILTALKSRVINQDADPEIGELVEVDLPDSGPERFLRVKCGTGREFALPVPPDMKTALQAQAWTWGVDEDAFIRPEVRT